VNFADYSALMSAGHADELLGYQRALGIVHPEFHYPGRRYWLSADDHHLGVKGHRRMAQQMLAALRDNQVCVPPPL